MSPDLPPEVWKKVTCEFQSLPGRASLASLALVSRKMSAIAQEELYNTLIISDLRLALWMKLIHLLSGKPAPPERPREVDPDPQYVDAEPYDEPGMGSNEPWSSKDILDDDSFKILETFDKFPHLGKLVRKIIFSGDPDGRATEGLFVRIAKLCPNISDIAIMATCKNPGGSINCATLAIAKHLPDLTKLTLVAYKLPSFVRALSALSSFTSLKDLHIGAIEYDLKKPRSLPPFKSRLEHLYVDGPFSTWLVPYLTTPSPDHLVSLRIELDDEEPINLATFKHLSHLSIRFSHHPILTSTLSTLSPECTTLKSFELSKLMMDDEIRDANDFHHVPSEVFTNLLPTSLERINLDYPLSRDGTGSYEGIRDGLRGKRWKSLKRLELKLREEGSRMNDFKDINGGTEDDNSGDDDDNAVDLDSDEWVSDGDDDEMRSIESEEEGPERNQGQAGNNDGSDEDSSNYDDDDAVEEEEENDDDNDEQLTREGAPTISSREVEAFRRMNKLQKWEDTLHLECFKQGIDLLWEDYDE